MIALDLLGREALEVHELGEPGIVFVGRPALFGRGAELRDDAVAVIDGENDVGVAGVDREKHGAF